jgi:CheY-like chemotaxis protein
MSATPIEPIATVIPVDLKKKRVLLVDTSASKREVRAEVMRKLGMDVDCAGDIREARNWWKADFYDLVLINVEADGGHRDRFCGDIRNGTPQQEVAFLVGKPEYLAAAPNPPEDSALEPSDEHAVALKAQAADAGNPAVVRQYWGIMEASRRISAVRSAAVARTRAMHSLPGPPRDSEGRASKRMATASSPDDLLRKEMQ